MSAENIKVFISYSHDDAEHSDWVYKLASKLVENGIETILDQWDLNLGANLPKFMAHGLSNSDRVLVVCTDNYIEKANNGRGGVGYENTILTEELLYDQETTKFIPVVRNVSTERKAPIGLAARTYIDFSNDTEFEQSFKKLLHELYGVPLRPKPALGRNPFKASDITKPKLNGLDSTVLFHQRFGKAFPGVRGTEWFQNEDAVQRLALLLHEPLVFEDGTPFWWWRSGDLHIEKFEVLDATTVLIDEEELIIDEIAAVNPRNYYQCFVYVKTKPSSPSGLYPLNKIEEDTKLNGYAREEFAVFKGMNITRAELDDGAAVIDGKPVALEGQAEIRIRYLTPYNLVIAPHNSPINNAEFYLRRDDLLNEILKGNARLEKFTEEFLKLPKRQTY